MLALAGVLEIKAAEPASRWVHFGASGKLVYGTTERGDRIMDFSYAGYMGGGVKLPDVAVKITVAPSGRDDTDAVQDAIHSVEKKELVDGFRGAVLLKPGNYNCQAALRIAASGVVVRGSGSGANGTTITLSGRPHACFSIKGSREEERIGGATRITDAYVSSGVNIFRVVDASGFKVGDSVQIIRPVTPEWVHFMGMDAMVRDGRKETWISGETVMHRSIREISGNQITLDMALTDSFDEKFISPPGGSMVKCAASGGISQVGIENLRIVSPPQHITITTPQYRAITMSGVTDGWVRDVAAVDTIGSMSISGESKRITIEAVDIQHTVATVGAAKPADFSINGMQILFNRCTGKGNDLFYFVTDARVTGPNVLLNCTFHGNGHLQPHARWATGLLVDGCRVPESGIDLMNRGEMGSGHGWTIGWSVAWNCEAKTFEIEQPPGAVNWAIGCRGKPITGAMPFNKEPLLPEGTYDSLGTPVTPESLYLAQLRERLGAQAVKNIGY